MKKLLTRKEKLEFYKKALEILKKGQFYGICYAMKKVKYTFQYINNDPYRTEIFDAITDSSNLLFKEFHSQKPIGNSAYWWPLTNEYLPNRIKVLENCIKSVERNLAKDRKR